MRIVIWFFCMMLLGLGCEKNDGTDDGDGGSGDTNKTDTVFEGDSGEFTDSRDQKTYPWVRIADQIWMAENMYYQPEGEGVTKHGDRPIGLFYTWSGAMALSSEYQTRLFNAESPHQGICPAGFHIPSVADWVHLADNVNDLLGPFTLEDGNWMGMGHVLKATTSWSENIFGEEDVPMGTDDLGFSARASGLFDRSGEYWGIGSETYYWSSTEEDFAEAHIVGLSTTKDYFILDSAFSKDYGLSVRCLKD